MEFRDCNVLDDGACAALWDEVGRPLIPSLLRDGVATPILHRSQLARLLGLPLPEEAPAAALAWDCAALLDAWVDGIRDLALDELLRPTRSRGRTLRNLTVNIAHPFELVPGAFESGVFPWDPDADCERERPLTTAAAVLTYAVERASAWRLFLARAGDEIAGERPPVESPRGEIAFPDLLAQQRWHAAFHYRQLVAHRSESGVPVDRPFDLRRLAGLELPVEVF